MNLSSKNYAFNFGVVVLLFILSSCRSNKQLINNQINSVAISVNTDTTYNENVPSLLSDSNLINAHIGICIFDPANKKYLFNYQSDKYFIPASNVKIATCYAAMKYLGDSLVGVKFLEDESNVYIQGSADPTFLHKDFPVQNLFKWLKSTNKHIYLCETKSTFKPLGKGWAWDDYKEPYLAERSEFPIYGNLVKFYYDETEYKTIPPYFEKFFSSQFQASDGNMKFDVTRNYGSNSFFFDIIPGKKDTVEITFNTNQTINPISTILGEAINKSINKSGYQKLVKKFYSQPTDSLLKPMMHNSDNFFAEQSLLMISNEKLGFMSDDRIIDTLLKSDFNDLPEKPKWVDGSGLSRYNLFTPQDFVCILNKIKNEFSWQRVKTIFPSGNDGTLKGYYQKYSNKIFAKTGSLSNNNSLSGFLIAKSGKELIFSIIINNHQATSSKVKLAIEKYLTMIIENN
jgi:D-alanyl-D-alanine carboxypeptidase/D-alanyl-D-alanine-endopeptidase (penicillin-binding protein 4)